MKPIQVISLAENNEVRREHMRSEFAKQGITEYAFFDAVTRSQVHEVLEAWKLSLIPPPSDIYEPLTLGEMGCLLSHVSLWRRMVEENMPYLFILEDDVFLGTNFKRLLQVDYLPKGTDVLKLEKSYFIKIDLGRFRLGSVAGRRLCRLYTEHGGTAGYLITLSGAKFLLSCLETMPIRQVDQFMFKDALLKHKHYQVVQLEPAICIQEQFLLRDISKERLSSSLRDDVLQKQAIELARRKQPVTSIWGKIKRELKRLILQLYIRRRVIDFY